MALYLNVPYGEKDEAKSLGAKWDAKVKKWYIDMARDKYVKFSKWILKDTYDAVIATEYIHIIEGEQKCWKCGQWTKVVGLGIGEFVHIFGEADDPEYEIVEDDVEPGEELHLAWVEKEEDIPKKTIELFKRKLFC